MLRVYFAGGEICVIFALLRLLHMHSPHSLYGKKNNRLFQRHVLLAATLPIYIYCCHYRLPHLYYSNRADEEKMAYNPNFEQIGVAFVQLYYSKFDVGDAMTRTAGLAELYDPDNSFLTFEGQQFKVSG